MKNKEDLWQSFYAKMKSDDFEKELQKISENLKSKGLSIEVCQRYLESVVDKYIAIKLSNISQEHDEKLNKIDLDFHHVEKENDEIDNIIKSIDSYILEAEAERKYLIKLYEENNPLHNGHLKIDPVSGTKSAGEK